MPRKATERDSQMISMLGTKSAPKRQVRTDKEIDLSWVKSKCRRNCKKEYKEIEGSNIWLRYNEQRIELLLNKAHLHGMKIE